MRWIVTRQRWFLFACAIILVCALPKRARFSSAPLGLPLSAPLCKGSCREATEGLYAGCSESFFLLARSSCWARESHARCSLPLRSGQRIRGNGEVPPDPLDSLTPSRAGDTPDPADGIGKYKTILDTGSAKKPSFRAHQVTRPLLDEKAGFLPKIEKKGRMVLPISKECLPLHSQNKNG